MISDGFYNCGKCGYYQPAFRLCILKNCGVDLSQSCDSYNQETPICDNCHKIANPLLVWTREDGEIKMLCKNCFQRM